MNHRPYPNRARAQAQLVRDASPPMCPLCAHPFSAHAVADGIATCGPAGRPDSCLECVRYWRQMPGLRGMAELGRALQAGPRLVVITGRQHGRTAAASAIETSALARGEHVHRASAVDGVTCLGGSSTCRTPRAETNHSGGRP